MKSARLVAVSMVLAAAVPCWGQFVRPPVVIPRPVPVPVHLPVPVHGGGTQQGANRGGDGAAAAWVIGVIAGVAGLVGAGFLIRYLVKRSARRAVIRITALPPGEAPQFVRQAWVGLELPLIQGQVETDNLPAQQVLSRQRVHPPGSYAVEGKAAIKILDSASPEAARWWRENAPDILAPGYQLVFPAEVCERLDDLGAHKVGAA